MVTWAQFEAAAPGLAATGRRLHRLFEFSIDSALVGERPTADDWPPRYTTWKAG